MDAGGRLDSGLQLEPVVCCLCGTADGEPIGVGKDFEYRTSEDSFLAHRCNGCGLVYLNPRPAVSEFRRIYPDTYHAFAFSEESFGLVYRVRRRLEAKRLLSLCRDLPKDARIIDVGCGDGFHLRLLKDFGPPDWRLEGVDLDDRAVERARRHGIHVHAGTVETLDLESGGYDFALMIQTIEHVASPTDLVGAVRRLLKPDGRLLIVTDNTGSLDFALFKGRHWGGYHFPRHWNLFHRTSMGRLAQRTNMEVARLATIVSPVNWTYSVRNTLDDYGAPPWLVRFFSLNSPIALGAFTLFDTVHQWFGRGALLQVVLKRPGEDAHDGAR